MKKIFIFLLAVAIIVAGIAIAVNIYKNAVDKNIDYTRWYNNIVDEFGLKAIGKVVRKGNVTSEYRMAKYEENVGYKYISFTIYKDGTGALTYKYNEAEEILAANTKTNDYFELSAGQVTSLKERLEETGYRLMERDDKDRGVYSGGDVYFFEMRDLSREYYADIVSPADDNVLVGIYDTLENLYKTLQ